MKGRRLPLSPGRRFIADLSWLANRVPQGVIRRTIAIAAVREARAAAETRLPWTVIFAKAYGLAARDLPQLRRTFATFPWPHLFEGRHSVASIIIERAWEGEASVLYARIKQPEAKSLAEIAGELSLALTTPVETFHAFRAMRIANRLPRPLRRLLWLYAFNSGPQRPKFFGTFGLTALGHRGVSMNYPVSPVTTVLTFGPIAADGAVEVTIGFDHRAMDGAAVADAIDALERHLNGAVAEELRGLAA
jgi:hypothetical protein